MTIADVSLSIDLRLNKGASSDYDNLWPYHKANAFNKAISDRIRRMKKGTNLRQEGDEETADRVDDLQVLLKKEALSVKNRDVYAESGKLPSDYLYFKRLTPITSKGTCSGVRIQSSLREEANVDSLLPTCSFEFEETFHTLIGNRAQVYHNKEFGVDRVELVYYRKPKVYTFENLDEVVEFKDDICELLIDEAVKILASDIESLNALKIAQERTEQND